MVAGAFVLPFMLMLVITGIPLFFLESSFGQYASSGVISIWKASPIFTGKVNGLNMPIDILTSTKHIEMDVNKMIHGILIL